MFVQLFYVQYNNRCKIVDLLRKIIGENTLLPIDTEYKKINSITKYFITMQMTHYA